MYSLAEIYNLILEHTDYERYIRTEKDKPDERIENIEELRSNIVNFEKEYEDNADLTTFLEEISLQTDIDNYDADSDTVVMMTLHSAKGLEFPVVFIPGMEEGIFPSNMTIMNPEEMDEERRLAYVGITRAKEKLILTGIKKDDIDWNAKGEVTAIDRLSGRSYFDWIKKALPMIPKQDYRLKIYTLEDLLWQQEGNELLHEMNRQIFYERLNDQIPNENVKALKESFAYHYRNEAETKGRLKYSVSEIKRMSQAADTEEVMYSSVFMEKEKRIPSFVKKTERISAASKGTIIHKVFELLDFSKDYTMKSLNEDIERWISLGKLKKEYEKVIYRKEILALTRSELGKRMKEAAQKKLLYKERQFVTGIPFSDMDKEAKTDDFVVVQGIIDVYFEEEDKIILVDYKTDRVREGEEDILIRRYRAQMESYQQALEKITGKCVKEIYIYSVTLQKTIPVHV